MPPVPQRDLLCQVGPHRRMHLIDAGIVASPERRAPMRLSGRTLICSLEADHPEIRWSDHASKRVRGNARSRVMRRRVLIPFRFTFLNAMCALFSLSSALPADRPPLDTVPEVNLERYAGKWYEIARLPNRFQTSCAGDVTATYELRPDGKIRVLNECRTAKGGVKSARGTARRANARGPNSKLKVTFFWPFSGDYWIIDLDPEYRWAVVGEPRRRYLWILSRAPVLPEETYRGILQRAAGKGFNVDRLLRTTHTVAEP